MGSKHPCLHLCCGALAKNGRETLLVVDREDRVMVVFLPPPKDAFTWSGQTFQEGCRELAGIMDELQGDYLLDGNNRRGKVKAVSTRSSHGNGRPVCFEKLRRLFY